MISEVEELREFKEIGELHNIFPQAALRLRIEKGLEKGEDTAGGASSCGLGTALRVMDLKVLVTHGFKTPIDGLKETAIVSLLNAVKSLGHLVSGIENKARASIVFATEHLTPEQLGAATHDEAAAMNLYTEGWAIPERSLYYILNSLLRDKDRGRLTPFLSYLKLLLTGLKNQPRYSGSVWRGVKADLRAHYPKGKKLFWWSFSSCTTEMHALENDLFLGKIGTRTLFRIDDCTRAVDIQSFSAFPTEAEVLVIPGAYLEVIDVGDMGHGLVIISLRQITPPYDVLGFDWGDADLGGLAAKSSSSKHGVGMGAGAGGGPPLPSPSPLHTTGAMDWLPRVTSSIEQLEGRKSATSVCGALLVLAQAAAEPSQALDTVVCAQGLSTVLRVMQHFHSKGEVAASACSLLATIARRPQNKKRIVSAGAIGQVFACMAAAEQEPAVLVPACQALHAIASARLLLSARELEGTEPSDKLELLSPSKKWRLCTVWSVSTHSVGVHFDGFGDEHDEEILRSSDRINNTGIRKAIGLHLASDTKSAGRVLDESSGIQRLLKVISMHPSDEDLLLHLLQLLASSVGDEDAAVRLIGAQVPKAVFGAMQLLPTCAAVQVAGCELVRQLAYQGSELGAYTQLLRTGALKPIIGSMNALPKHAGVHQAALMALKDLVRDGKSSQTVMDAGALTVLLAAMSNFTSKPAVMTHATRLIWSLLHDSSRPFPSIIIGAKKCDGGIEPEWSKPLASTLTPGASYKIVRSVPADATFDLKNADEVRGNVVLIERGDNGFAQKVTYAQAAGAVAMIVSNADERGKQFPDVVITMGGGEDSVTDTIPSFMLSYNDSYNIKDGTTLILGETSNDADHDPKILYKRVFKAGGVKHLLAAMRACAASRDVQFNGCAAMYLLANASDSREEIDKRMVEAGALRTIFAAMRQFGDDRGVLYKGQWAASCMAVSQKEGRDGKAHRRNSAFVGENGIELFMEIARNPTHTEDTELLDETPAVGYGIAQMCYACVSEAIFGDDDDSNFTSEGYRGRLLRAGFCNAAPSLETDKEHCIRQQTLWMSGAMNLLAGDGNSPWLQTIGRQMIEEGALKHTIQVVLAFPDEQALLALAYTTISRITLIIKSVDANVDAVARHFREADGSVFAVVLRSLMKWHDTPDVANEGSVLLCNLAIGDLKQQLIAADGVERLLELISEHPAHKMTADLVGALSNITAPATARIMALGRRFPNAIFAFLKAQPDETWDSRCQHYGLQALVNVTVEDEGRHWLYRTCGRDALQLCMAAMRRHPEHVEVQSAGAGLLLNLQNIEAARTSMIEQGALSLVWTAARTESKHATELLSCLEDVEQQRRQQEAARQQAETERQERAAAAAATQREAEQRAHRLQERAVAAAATQREAEQRAHRAPRHQHVRREVVDLRERLVDSSGSVDGKADEEKSGCCC
jgi:hypothetical protein